MPDPGKKIQIKKNLPHWGLIAEIEGSRAAQVDAALKAVTNIYYDQPDLLTAKEAQKLGHAHGIMNGQRIQLTAFVVGAQAQLETAPPGQKENLERSLAPVADKMFAEYLRTQLVFLEGVQNPLGGYGAPNGNLTRAAKYAEKVIQGLLPQQQQAR